MNSIVYALMTLMVISLVSGCYRPRAPSYGTVRVYGIYATYSCNHGYRLTNTTRTARCYMGRWMPSPLPHCLKVVCSRLPKPSFGTVIVVGEMAFYRCNFGYRLSGDSPKLCSLGKWYGSQPSCVRSYLCSRLSNPPHGMVTVYGSRAIYRCNSGYKLTGYAVRICSSGKWSGSSPTCM
eukprot:m.219535 g.219535  ORF g.219535 m.219535 type:complete len:179 (+) comp39924_c0_seq31:645-1181(+)